VQYLPCRCVFDYAVNVVIQPFDLFNPFRNIFDLVERMEERARNIDGIIEEEVAQEVLHDAERRTA